MTDAVALSLLDLGSARFQRFSTQMLEELNIYSRTLSEKFAFPSGAGLELQIIDRADVNAGASFEIATQTYRIRFHLGLCVWAFDIASGATAMFEEDYESDKAMEISLDVYRRNVPRAQLIAVVKEADDRIGRYSDGYAEPLFRTILLTVFLHELAHIVRGHIDDYRAAADDRHAVIDELSMAADTRAEMWTRIRAYEYDADRFATDLLFELAHHPPEALRRWALNTPEQNLAFALFSNALFNAAVYEAQTRNRMTETSYPSPLLRFSIAVSRMHRAHLNNNSEVDFDTDVLEKTMSMLSLHEPIFPVIDHFRLFTDNPTLEALREETSAVIDDFERVEFDLQVKRFEPVTGSYDTQG